MAPTPPPPAPEPGPIRPAAARETGSRVFTNKDLQRYQRVKEEFGFRGDVVTVDLSGRKPGDQEVQGPAPLTDAQRDEEIQAARDRIAALTSETAYLRGRIPSLHNPFLPRPTLSDADKAAEAGMDNVQRLQRVTGRLSEADAELRALQQRLAELYQIKPANAPPP